MRRQPQKKRKVDYTALKSPFMRIPRMDVAGARALLDLGFREIYELRGRDPESLVADLSKIKVEIPPEMLKYMKLATDFAETQ